MAELSDFDKKLVEIIQTSGATKGAGATIRDRKP